MKIKKFSRKTFAVLMASILTVGAIFPATVSNASAEFKDRTIQQGTVVKFSGVKKTMPSGTSAKLTMYNAISRYDIVNTYVKNVNDERVTDSTSFRETAKNAVGYMPYTEEIGTKGNTYYLCMTLSQGSQSPSLTLSFYFAP